MLHGDLSDGQMAWLYQHDKVKCLVNLAHGEGFGLPIFEAAQNALPVITIDWSGQRDYLNHDGEKYFSAVKHEMKKIPPEAVWEGVLDAESEWAYPVQGSFKLMLKRMKKNWKKHSKKAMELQSLVNEKYTEETMYKLFCEQVYNPEEQSEDTVVL